MDQDNFNPDGASEPKAPQAMELESNHMAIASILGIGAVLIYGIVNMLPINNWAKGLISGVTIGFIIAICMDAMSSPMPTP